MSTRAKLKAISDEEIIAALLQHGTIKEAAAAVGAAPRTVYDRMRDKEFISSYMEAKNDVLRVAVLSINKRISEAVDAIAEIMNNSDVNPATRLQAAQTILSNASKYAAILAAGEDASRTFGDPFAYM